MRGWFGGAALAKKVRTPLFPQCGACGLLRTCKSPKMPVWGEGRRGVLAVGEAPGAEEDDKNRPFVGKAGRFLKDALRRLDVDLGRDCWVTNSLICRPPDNKISNDRCIDYCRPNLLKVIRDLQPRTILLLGARAVQSLIGWLWKEDVGGVERWLGWNIPNQRLKAWVCPAWHPSHLQRMRDEKDGRPNEAAEKIWERHLAAAFAHEDRPAEEPDHAKVVEVELDPERAARSLQGIIAEGRPVAFDYETDRVKPDHPDAEIVCCSVYDGERSLAYPWHGAAIAATRELLRSPLPKLGWNNKFEERWTLAKLGTRVRNWRYDGMQGSHVLDCRPGITSLKFQVFVRLGVEEWDTAVKPYLKSDGGANSKNRIREVDLRTLLFYCGLDSLYEYKVDVLQMQELSLPPL